MKVQRRRALTPIIAELLLLALTVSIGTAFYLVGSSTVSGYAGGLQSLFGLGSNSAKEIYVVEYANFAGSSAHYVDLTVRNVGFVETQLASVGIFNETSTSGDISKVFDASSLSVVGGTCTPVGAHLSIPVQGFCTVRLNFDWTQGTAYNFVVSTSLGNSMVVEEIG